MNYIRILKKPINGEYSLLPTKTGKELWKKREKYWIFIVCTDGNNAYQQMIHKTSKNFLF
jgi:hypothetical protein